MPTATNSSTLHRAILSRNKASSVIEQAREIQALYTQAKNFYTRRTRWTISISSNDRLYDVAHRWFMSDDLNVKPPRQLNARYASNRKPRYIDDEFYPGATTGASVEMYYDERGERQVVIEGHKVTVSMIKPEMEGEPSTQGGAYRPARPDVIYFHAVSKEGQDAVGRLLSGLAADQNKQKPALYLLSGWGNWDKRDDLPERSLESVVLKTGQMERIRDDIQSFRSEEADYVRRGIPYHRGYMLYGPPGTGKTSIVRALAAHFGLDLWYAPLGDLQKDASLMSLINQVRAGSILLLEDIDVYHSARERDDEAGSMSMAGLLNALDGVATPHGLITFMTTNDIDVIDEALLRPGRVDLREEISMPDRDQIARLFNSWYNTKLSVAASRKIKWTGSTAELSELFKRNLNDDASALAAIQKPRPAAD